MSSTSASKKYDDPPIIEVVCGVYFDALPQLDPVMVGKYWSQIAAEYPRRELRPAVREDGFLLAPVPPIRAMLISPDGATLLQIQQDRFYFNWRRDNFDAPYPRFSDHDGEQGVGALAANEFGRFAQFCQEAIGAAPVTRSIELAKVDLLMQGKHWSDFGDLAKLLPWLQRFHAFSKSPMPNFALRFDEHRAVGLLSVVLGLTTDEQYGDSPEPRSAVKLEARLTKPVVDVAAVSGTFAEVNVELNRVFEELIPEQERDARFTRKKGK